MIRMITLIILLLLPTTAFADLYKYKAKDGSIIISSRKRSGLKLIEVTRTGRRAKKRAKPMKSALQRPRVRTQSYARAKKKHNRFDGLIKEAAQKYNVPFAFVKAVIRVESAFNPRALSHAGAMGLMQMMPKTAASMGVKDPYDARQNIFGGTKFLRILTDRYEGDINLILAAYNAGDRAVARYKGIPYPQTRGYVSSVYRWYRKYSEE